MRLASHPLHPALVHLPIGLWVVVPVWDLIGYWQGEPFWWGFSFYCLACGLVVALPAMVTGFADYIAIKKESTQQVATLHLILMVSATALMLVGLILRDGKTSHWHVSLNDFLITTAGVIVLIIGGWYGGSLVYRHGIGQRQGVEEHDLDTP